MLRRENAWHVSDRRGTSYHTGAGACDEISRWVAGRAAGAPEVHKRLLKQSEVLKRFLASRGEDQLAEDDGVISISPFFLVAHVLIFRYWKPI